MPFLRVIALISGGKDSFMSLLHCLANGHRVVALANLYPFNSANEDLESFMYQTVGNHFLPLYESALNTPLYRQEIRGQAIDSKKTYSSASPDDETESLVPLLERIIKKHPDADALCSGAILSDYQRTRVETIALRFNLVPLSYLWQYPTLFPHDPAALLRHMAHVGMDARIIKVASGGLDESFLWKNVADPIMIARLNRAINKYGYAGPGAVLGEGGEFETIVLDGPDDVFKRRLVPKQEYSKLVQSGGGSSFLSFSGIANEETEAKVGVPKKSSGNLVCPGKLDPIFAVIFNDHYPHAILDLAAEQAGFQPTTHAPPQSLDPVYVAESCTEGAPFTFALFNLSGFVGQSVESQMQTILSYLKHWLRTTRLDSKNVVFSTLLLRRISSFSAINKLYGEFFNGINPPARVTVGCGDQMPEGVHVLMNVVADKYHPGRSLTLHVQSRSYWAPANIGPYSQAVSVQTSRVNGQWSDDYDGHLVYISGQIPLDPATMEIIEDATISSLLNYWKQVILSLQHVYRVQACTQVSGYENAQIRAVSVVAFLAGEDHIKERLVFCQRAWSARTSVQEVTADEDDIDPWDRLNRPAANDSNDSSHVSKQSAAEFVFDATLEHDNVFRLIALVEELPQKASIEWAALSWSGPVDETRLSESNRDKEPLNSSISLNSGHLLLVTSLVLRDDVFVLDGNPIYVEQIISMSRKAKEKMEIVHKKSHRPKYINSLTTIYVDSGLVDPAKLTAVSGSQIVPCKAVWSSKGTPLAAGIVDRAQIVWMDNEPGSNTPP
ncbi:MAG: hypothetical protein M1814_004925 [Vezdaea aestivalis]|nr:MAG: hypothetical protein M1814_004925 [Vezdaea aestivalis]